jgi:hypothetical protein
MRATNNNNHKIFSHLMRQCGRREERVVHRLLDALVGILRIEGGWIGCAHHLIRLHMRRRSNKIVKNKH